MPDTNPELNLLVQIIIESLEYDAAYYQVEVNVMTTEELCAEESIEDD